MTEGRHLEEDSSPELAKFYLPLSSGVSDALCIYTGRLLGGVGVGQAELWQPQGGRRWWPHGRKRKPEALL